MNGSMIRPVTKIVVGKPCKKCGSRDKYASNHSCIRCRQERARMFHQANPEARRDDCRRRYAEHREERREASRQWKQQNPNARREYYAQHKEKELAQNKLWRKRNHRDVIYLATKRKKRIVRATPSWANEQAIRLFYRSCPPNMEVDHVVPIGGRIVCGLHVPWNLQYLTPEANKKKNNRWPIEQV